MNTLVKDMEDQHILFMRRIIETPGYLSCSYSRNQSPIGGLDGAIPIRQSGAAMAPGDEIATPPQSPYVDLRWLGARLPRAISYQSEPAPEAKPADSQPLFFGQLAPDATVSGSIVSFPTSQPVLNNASDASVPAQQASVNAVIDMLNSWQNSGEKARHVAP